MVKQQQKPHQEIQQQQQQPPHHQQQPPHHQQQPDSNYNEVQQYPYVPPQDEPRAVFVTTTLNTRLAVLISPLHNFSTLKQQISLEHFNCFPKHGRILIKSISVKINDNYYDVSDTILLKSAFYEPRKPWVVSAVVWTPVGSLELPNQTEAMLIKPPPQNDHGGKIPRPRKRDLGGKIPRPRNRDHGGKIAKPRQRDHEGMIRRYNRLISKQKHTTPSPQKHYEQIKVAIPTMAPQ